ncbi:MAG: protein kinase, partial [Deltaproteobacteria bacterium]
MAEIHIAKQRGMEGFEKIVVIKTILPHLVSNQEFVQMFLDEARIAARLTHPNIVQIYDLGRVANNYFIAMEYVQGENLRQVARACRKNGRLIPVEHTVKIISQACEGLHYAHNKTDPAGQPLNIVHRDISPQNILVSFEGVAKIVDFGIAKAATQYQETRAGVLKGKYSYMSPEQCTGQPIDGRSDIFSMGIVLWELVTGVRLYKRDSELMILKDITEGNVPSPRQVNQRIPAELEAIILKCLEKNPPDRFQTALELHLALEQFLKNQDLTSSTVHISAFMRSLFADKLENLRKIEQAQAAGQRLEEFLFDDIEQSDVYTPGTTPARQTTTPVSAVSGSQPIIPKPTTGVSRMISAPAAPARRVPWIGLFLGLLVLVGAGIVLWKLLPAGDHDQQHTTPPPPAA